MLPPGFPVAVLPNKSLGQSTEIPTMLLPLAVLSVNKLPEPPIEIPLVLLPFAWLLLTVLPPLRNCIPSPHGKGSPVSRHSLLFAWLLLMVTLSLKAIPTIPLLFAWLLLTVTLPFAKIPTKLLPFALLSLTVLSLPAKSIPSPALLFAWLLLTVLWSPRKSIASFPPTFWFAWLSLTTAWPLSIIPHGRLPITFMFAIMAYSVSSRPIPVEKPLIVPLAML